MRLFIPVVAGLISMSCGGASPAADPSSRGAGLTRDALVAGLREYAAAAQAFDSSRVMAMLANDSTFRFVDGQTLYTRDEFAKLVGETFATLKAFEARFAFDSMTVIDLSPTSAVTIVPYTDLLTDASGAVTTVRGVVTWVWVVRDGSPRLAAGHAAAKSAETTK